MRSIVAAQINQLASIEAELQQLGLQGLQIFNECDRLDQRAEITAAIATENEFYRSIHCTAARAGVADSVKQARQFRTQSDNQNWLAQMNSKHDAKLLQAEEMKSRGVIKSIAATVEAHVTAMQKAA